MPKWEVTVEKWSGYALKGAFVVGMFLVLRNADTIAAVILFRSFGF